MSNDLPSGYAVPNTSLPKTTGTLNIIFASLLLFFVVGQMGMTILGPKLMQFAQQQVEEAQANVAATRQRQIDTLKESEAAVQTEEEKEQIRAQIEAIEAQPAPAGPDMIALADQMKNPAIRAYSWTDQISALILNGLMLASGIGLLWLKEGARRLAIWVGALKIVRLVALALVYFIVVQPVMTKAQQDMMVQMAAGGGANAQAMQSAAKIGAAASTAMIGIGAVLGMIWPIIMIILLTRPGSRAACLATSIPPAVEAEGP